VHFVGVFQIWLRYRNAWKGNLQYNPSEGVINKSSGAEYKESCAERRREFDGCCYVNMHKWCTGKVTGSEVCKHGYMAKLQHISVYILTYSMEQSPS